MSEKLTLFLVTLKPTNLIKIFREKKNYIISQLKLIERNGL